jgi:DNA helicase-2/ATP-dependent DNA helicase PcrA
MERRPSQILLDELGQYFFLYKNRNWQELTSLLGKDEPELVHKHIDGYFNGKSGSKHNAVGRCISLFNRFSEECLDPRQIKTKNTVQKELLSLYQKYLDLLAQEDSPTVDFSLIQKSAFDVISSCSKSGKVFRHVIIDEYQDTNAIQEKIYFALAKGHKNICVVGDDDQALYRFRGATVENLVEFEDRCKCNLKVTPKTIDLNKNFRSRSKIVDFYKGFIETEDWSRGKGKKGHYRVAEKNITPYSTDTKPSVIVSEKAKADGVYEEIAQFIKGLKVCKKIDDYSQVAVLFPAMKGWRGPATRVAGFMRAFEKHEIPVYAPRAGRFLEIQESVDVYGLLMAIFGKPVFDGRSYGMQDYCQWMDRCQARANELMGQDEYLKAYIESRRQDLGLIAKDYNILARVSEKKRWDKAGDFTDDMIVPLSEAAGLSQRAKKALTNSYFRASIIKRRKQKRPFTLSNVLNRATSVDWTVLDLFYQLNGFKHFRKMYDLAQSGMDEGPICNLGLVTQYLDRFMDQYSPIITASFMKDDKFTRSFFGSFNYALFRRSESEFEDAQDPFPKGRVSFLTIHQAKGLEFPIVIMGSLYKDEKNDHFIEEMVRTLTLKSGEPLEKISRFDIMRMFYVALSRSQNLLVLPDYKGPKSKHKNFNALLVDSELPKISEFNINTLPKAKQKNEDLGTTYSYTGDYLEYQKCPRSYMIFRKYGFTPSRSQTMFFGSLVHKTIEDLHYFLKSEAQKNG